MDGCMGKNICSISFIYAYMYCVGILCTYFFYYAYENNLLDILIYSRSLSIVHKKQFLLHGREVKRVSFVFFRVFIELHKLQNLC